jgi:UDP-glucose 4-epimerase
VKVLITGGAGFIGSHLCDALVAKGEEVVILDNLSTGSKNNIAHLEGKIQVFQGDIRDQNLVESLIKDCDLVLHMAAALGVENILENPVESISTNYQGSEIILKATVKYNKRILISSTSEIYGKNPKQLLSETDDRIIGTPQKLRWSYSDAKALEEAAAHHYYVTKNLPVTTVRFFNTVGPRQSGKYGMVIPRFVESALSDNPVKIFGDGTQSRVFCHVTDTVKAIILLLESSKAIGEVFNIGGIEEISIRHLAEKVIKLTKSNSIINFTPYTDAYGTGYEDMIKRVPDISKIHKYVGWSPKVSLDQIILDVAKFESQRNLGQP